MKVQAKFWAQNNMLESVDFIFKRLAARGAEFVWTLEGKIG